jgi:hypothetical protein
MSKATDKEDDLRLARDLLKGRWGETGEVTYLKGEEALKARAALARLILAGPLDPGLRGMLATVIEPEPNAMSFLRTLERSGCAIASDANLQTVDFRCRSNKPRSRSLRNEIVGLWMQRRLDDKTAVSVKHAQDLAMKEFTLKPSVAKDIWLERLEWQRIRAVISEVQAVGLWMQRRLDDKTAVSVKHAQDLATKEFNLKPSAAKDIWRLEWQRSTRASRRP